MNGLQTVFRLLLLASLCFSISCSSKSDEPEYDINARLSAGWDNFNAEDYQSTKAIFQEVLDHESNNAEAHLGLGWALAYLSDLSGSATSLLSAIDVGLEGVDAHMGLATVYRDLPDFNQALAYSDQVLAADSEYVFSKRTSIDFLDAHLIKAQVYFRMGIEYYEELHTELTYLSGQKGLASLPDPGNMSDRDYEAILLERLEVLTSLIED